MTATPRHNNGAIFVQTVSRLSARGGDPPERRQASGAAGCREPRQAYTSTQSAIFTEKYADYLQLGVEEWRKSYAEHETLGKKAVLFVMVDDTRTATKSARYLETNLPRAAGGGSGHPHQEQWRDFRGGLRQEQGGTRTASQGVECDRHVGHRRTRRLSRS